MQRYIQVYDALYAYFENMLMDDGANTWEEYKTIVGTVGPHDEELWALFVKLEECVKMQR
jgi:hypothetical protein